MSIPLSAACWTAYWRSDCWPGSSAFWPRFQVSVTRPAPSRPESVIFSIVGPTRLRTVSSGTTAPIWSGERAWTAGRTKSTGGGGHRDDTDEEPQGAR
jgi:hypothetical protein